MTAGEHGQQLFDVLVSPVRREILWLTWDRELTVGEIGAHLEVSAPTLSSHLTALRDAGLVHMEAAGTFRRYRAIPESLAAVIPLLAVSDERWRPADDLPERDLAAAERGVAVTVRTELPVPPADACAAFLDEERFSDWLGVPVRIREGRFATRMEWGTQIRGAYEVVAPPHLIAVTWDFEDEVVPVPGGQRAAYLRFHATADGSRVEVQQLAADDQEADYFTAAWSMVLGRLAEAHQAAARPPRQRRARPKRR